MVKYKRKPSPSFLLEEPEAAYSSRVRAIGNSKGVILNADILSKAGLNANEEILIQAAKGAIIIVQAHSVKEQGLHSWDQKFREAKKKGTRPGTDPFERLENKFDKEEW